MTENVFPETNMHPFLHFHISHSVFLSSYLIMVVNGAQQTFFIVVFWVTLRIEA